MSSYHTSALLGADVFTLMGSIYAEVARYDSALKSGDTRLAKAAASRADELVDFALKSEFVNPAQKLEVQKFQEVFKQNYQKNQPSNLDSYLMPFAVGARIRTTQ